MLNIVEIRTLMPNFHFLLLVKTLEYTKNVIRLVKINKLLKSKILDPKPPKYEETRSSHFRKQNRLIRVPTRETGGNFQTNLVYLKMPNL